MANLTLEQNSLHGGEIDPRLYGRRDLPLYANALARCRNALPAPTGGVGNRPGTRKLVHPVIHWSGSTAIMREEFYHTVTLDGVAHRYLMGLAEKNNGFGFSTTFVVAIFALDGTQLAVLDLPAAVIGKVAGLETIRVEREKEISSASLDNVLYLAHHLMAPQTIVRGATDNDWTIAPLTLSPAVTIWSDVLGWPRCVCAAEQRLIFGASTSKPTTIWGSRINSYGDFLVGDATADAPWSYTLASTSTRLRRLLVYDNILAFSGDAVLAVSGTDTKIPTALGVRAPVRLAEGCSNYAAPVLFGSDLLFVPDDGRRLLMVEYSLDVDKFVSVDLSQHARHLITAPIYSMTVTRQPLPVIWLVLKDGALLSCTYDPTNQVVAWARHDRTAGPTVDTDSGAPDFILYGWANGHLAKAVLSIPQEDGDDRLYLLSGFGLEEFDYSLRLDAAPTLTVDGTTASGLGHLQGITVQILINGVPQAPQVVSATGTITVPAGTLAADLQAGLPISVQVKPLPPPLQASTGQPARALKEMMLLHETQTLTVDGQPLPFYPDDGGVLPLVSGWTEITPLRGWSSAGDTLTPEITLTTPHTFTLLALARQVTLNS